MRGAGLILGMALASSAAAQTVGAGVKVGNGTQVGIAVTTAPMSGIVFTPASGPTGGTSPTISYPPDTAAKIFYTLDGSPAYPSRPLYTGPFTLATGSTTVNAIAQSVGTNSVLQNTQNCGTSCTSLWKTDVDTSNTVGNITGNCPRLGTGGGVAGVITDCEFQTGITTPSLSGSALHLSFTSTTSGTSQRQVLWTKSGHGCDDCTQLDQDFYIQPAEAAPTTVWAYENDQQLWDSTRRLELTAGMQCYNGDWNASGQSGWQHTGISASCPLPAGVWTHMHVRAHRDGVGTSNCTHTDKLSPVAMTATQTTITVLGNLITGMIVTVDSEKMLVGAWAGSSNAHTWTVTRGYSGTVAAAHAASAPISAPIECINYDWIEVNGAQFTVGKKFPAGVLPPTWSGGCYNQHQIDYTHAGTVGEYIDNDNMTCSYAPTEGTGTTTYTNP